MKEKYFTIMKNNKLERYDILFSFSENSNNYVVYSDDDNNFLASKYKVVNNKLELYPITEKKEWSIINKKLGERYG